MVNKKQLAIFLSKLRVFERPKVRLEQYHTDSEIGAEFLWFAFMQGDVAGKVVADFAAGPGILGIGALLLGAKKVYFVDVDQDALLLARENLKVLDAAERKRAVLVCQDVVDFKQEVDVVIQNPPFGVQLKNIDTKFLEKAFSVADVVYSMHKTSTSGYIHELAEKHGFDAQKLKDVKFPLPRTMGHHRKERKFIDVTLWLFRKSHK